MAAPPGKGTDDDDSIDIYSTWDAYNDSDDTFQFPPNMTLPELPLMPPNMNVTGIPPHLINVTGMPPWWNVTGEEKKPKSGGSSTISDSLYNASALSMFSFTFLVTIPLIIYCGVDIYRYRHEQYLMKRRISIIICLYVIIAIHGLVKVPLKALQNMKYIEISALEDDTFSAIIEYTDFTFQWLIILVLNVRAWLLHFEHHYETVLASKPWAPLLSPCLFESNFYIKHVGDIGNAGFLLKFVVTPLIVLRIVCRAVIEYGIYDSPDVYPSDFKTWSFMALLLISALFIGLIWSKYPAFDDIYFIKNEFRIVFIAVGLICFLITVTNLLSTVESLNIEGKYFQLFMLLVFQAMYCFMLWMMVIYPKWRIQKAIQELEQRQQRFTAGTLHELDLTAAHWEREIAEKSGYEAFAAFLSKELAVENLLFVTEKSAMVIAFHDKFKEININNKSEIKAGLLETMRQFFVKYIEMNKAPLEINIASRRRRLLTSIFGKCSTEELVDREHVIQTVMVALEEAADETENLMHDAAIRYRCERRQKSGTPRMGNGLSNISSASKNEDISMVRLAPVLNGTQSPSASDPSVTDGEGGYASLGSEEKFNVRKFT